MYEIDATHLADDHQTERVPSNRVSMTLGEEQHKTHGDVQQRAHEERCEDRLPSICALGGLHMLLLS